MASGEYCILVAKIKRYSCFYADLLTMNVSSLGNGHQRFGDRSYVLITDRIWDFWELLSSLSLYLLVHHWMHRGRVTSLILKHLFVANSLVIAFKGIPQTMEAFGLKIVLSDSECKLALYRLSRGVSLGTTCLLSVFQAIIISLRNSRWAELKVIAPKHVVPAVFLCWALYMLVNITFPLYVTGRWNNKPITHTNTHKTHTHKGFGILFWGTDIKLNIQWNALKNFPVKCYNGKV